MNFDLQSGIAVLERTPKVARALLTGLGDEWTRPNEGPNTWSPFDVLEHLIQNEETNWMVRARVILAEGGNRRFAPLDRVAHPAANQRESVVKRLDRFDELRAGNLSELKKWNLGEPQLKRTGEHPEFGPVTMAQLLATWVAHDLSHIGQMVRVMARQYRDAVGPWRAYLPLLSR